MAFSSVRTIRGRNLAAKVEAGTVKLNFTKIVIGDGSLSGQQPQNLTNVISPKQTVDIKRLKVINQNTVVVGTSFNNQNFTAGFFWREVGVFATDPDLGEILYAYANSGTGAEYLDASGTSNVIERSFNFNITINDSAQVTAVIDSSLVYATPQDVADALASANQYTDTKFGAIKIQDASTTQKGIVQLTNTNTGTSQTLAPTQKALGDHVNNQVAHMTQQQKDQLANSFSRDGGTITGPVTIKSQSPLSSSKGSTIQLSSTEFSASNSVKLTTRAVRVEDGNSWESAAVDLRRVTDSTDQAVLRFYKDDIQFQDSSNVWTSLRDLKQSGVDRKNELVAALNAKKVAASANEDFSSLVAKVYNIRAVTYSGTPYSPDNLGNGDDGQLVYQKPSGTSSKDFLFTQTGNDIYSESLTVSIGRIDAFFKSQAGSNILAGGTVTNNTPFTTNGFTFAIVSRSQGNFTLRVSVSSQSTYDQVRFRMGSYIGVGI